ncbi:MAG: type II toxin-antitoxin system HicB family antitoxin [Terriglobia bacterium]
MPVRSLQVVIEKESEDEGYFAYSPALRGCFSNGKSIEEVRRNSRDCTAEFGSWSGDLERMAEWLKARGIKTVVIQ